MIVTTEQIIAGLIKYIDNDLAAKASGITKFLIYFWLPSASEKISPMLAEIKSSGLFTEMFDENGNVKLDIVHTRAMEAVHRSGKIYIKGLNYFADEGDIDIIYNYIKNS